MTEHFLTDRDERALVAAAGNRIAEPLRVRALWAAVRRLSTHGRARRPGPAAQGRESLTCQPNQTVRLPPAPSNQAVRPLP
ncbi:hypothetical protein [Streptomyces sp. NPDC048606]|uniref:hypothetical protein n=1 Tax=Streptomyces sp. NPDC048606 TaxID=3154726 RepID=UPI003423AAFC